MASLKQHRSTALTILVVAVAVVFGFGSLVDPDASTLARGLGAVVLAAGAAAGIGLWSLATGRLTQALSQTLVVVGLGATGVLAIQALVDDFAFMVWVFGPVLVLTVLALWLGVVNRGLRAELGN